MTVVFTSKTSEFKIEEGFQTVIHLNVSCSIISVFTLVSASYSLLKGQLGNISGSRRQIFSSQNLILYSIPSVLSVISKLTFNLNYTEASEI